MTIATTTTILVTGKAGKERQRMGYGKNTKGKKNGRVIEEMKFGERALRVYLRGRKGKERYVMWWLVVVVIGEIRQ